MKRIFAVSLAALTLILAGCTAAPEPTEDTDVTEAETFIEADITNLPSLALSGSVYDADGGTEIEFSVIADDEHIKASENGGGVVCRVETDGGSIGYMVRDYGDSFSSIPHFGDKDETEEKLVFSRIDKPEYRLTELETFNWRPSEDGKTPELSYVKVVFTEEGQNVGYAFAEIEYDGAGHAEARILCRGTFPKVDGKYQDVTDFYIDRRTFEAREQSRREHAGEGTAR